MEQVRVLRIVVASPGDVQAERKALPDVIDEINRGVAADRNLRLELSRWETDTYPGFHADGPQGEIDKILRIDDCDLLIGIFWHRFGTPTMDAASGTEHEFRLAYQTWQRSRRPQIMVYFNANAYSPRSREETDQWGRVLEFQRNFPKEGLWWPYRGSKHLASLVRNHLTHYVRTLHDVRPLHAPWIAVDDENTSQGVLETADDGATKDLDEIRKILNEQARIEVVRYITKGEISNVYLGRYGTRLMAIKEIDAAELSSSDRTKLKKEIELGSLLRDPAFLRLCQVIFHSGRCFIVTDFFEGETIAHKIQQGPVFSTGDVIEILYQLSGGIAEAHARGMQYLRITPSDIFVHSDKILDRQIVRLSPINFKYFIE